MIGRFPLNWETRRDNIAQLAPAHHLPRFHENGGSEHPILTFLIIKGTVLTRDNSADEIPGARLPGPCATA